MADLTKEKANAAIAPRIQYIDILRVMSMLSVVFLHIAASNLRTGIGSSTWHFSNFLTSFMSVAVPIFFMISGAMLLNSSKTLSIKFVYKKRLSKAFIPFFVWSLVAVVYYAAMSLNKTGHTDFAAAIVRLRNLPAQATSIHLWFMYALIPLYLLSPILKKLVDSLTPALMKYLFAIWLIFSSVLPTVVSLLPQRYKSLLILNSSYNLNLLNGYLGYFLLGYFLYKYKDRISKKLLAAIVGVDTLVIAFGTWYSTNSNGSYSELFKGYSRIFVLVLSVALFLLVKEIFAERRLKQKSWAIVQFLSTVSFGVYLLHNILIDWLTHILKLLPADSILMSMFCYIIILLASIFVIVLLSSFKPTCFAFTGMSYDSACRNNNIQYFLKKIFGKKSPLVQEIPQDSKIGAVEVIQITKE